MMFEHSVPLWINYAENKTPEIPKLVLSILSWLLKMQLCTLNLFLRYK